LIAASGFMRFLVIAVSHLVKFATRNVVFGKAACNNYLLSP
jgi:hypothetical protein